MMRAASGAAAAFTANFRLLSPPMADMYSSSSAEVYRSWTSEGDTSARRMVKLLACNSLNAVLVGFVGLALVLT